MQFWYGVYGFRPKSCNDEITIYWDEDKNSFAGYFDLATERCLAYLLEHDLDPQEDREFCDEIEAFLQGNKEVAYSYIYPRNEKDMSRQVPHHAPRNDQGQKPVYIMLFSKLSPAWDLYEIEKTVLILAREFLQLEIEKVEFLDIPTYEETRLSYEQDYAPYI